jgi:prolyl-tRNA editing enzyme YbaK/EbsC (Cys-tRNA(Pro) deacylase)
MSVQSVRAFFADKQPQLEVQELQASTATVPLAAAALSVAEGQIAKTLSLRLDDRVILLVMRGDSRMDNKKFKAAFGTKARMLGTEEVEQLTGHPVGGVCPFGLAAPLPIYCDVSLKEFEVVFTAAGAPNAMVRIAPEQMVELVNAQWIDVAQVAVAA